MRRLVRRPSASLVVACGAFFLASTGTGLADVAQLARNSVGTPQLRNNAVTTPKIRNNAVTLAKLAPNARVPGSQGPPGPQGPAGPQGPPGPPGAPVNLADGAITTAKLANNAVTTAKLADNVVTSAKIADGQVRARDLGPIQLVTNRANIGANANGTVLARCPVGTRLISGGGFSSHFLVFMLSSYRSTSAWAVSFRNTSAGTQSITAVADCLVAP